MELRLPKPQGRKLYGCGFLQIRIYAGFAECKVASCAIVILGHSCPVKLILMMLPFALFNLGVSESRFSNMASTERGNSQILKLCTSCFAVKDKGIGIDNLG